MARTCRLLVRLTSLAVCGANAAPAQRWEPLPAPPVPPRFDALAHAIGERVFVLWGHALQRRLFADGALYRLR